MKLFRDLIPVAEHPRRFFDLAPAEIALIEASFAG
jgi:hypothetical protein